MDRAKFNKCVGDGMRGKTLTREERKLGFCSFSKLCSGKAKTQDEAIALCSQPKEAKAVKATRQSPSTCEKDALSLSHCIAERIDMSRASNVNSIETAIVDAMLGCRCQK